MIKLLYTYCLCITLISIQAMVLEATKRTAQTSLKFRVLWECRPTNKTINCLPKDIETTEKLLEQYSAPALWNMLRRSGVAATIEQVKHEQQVLQETKDVNGR